MEEFNRNVYDIIIAADEKNDMLGDDEAAEGEGDEAKEKATEGDDDAEVEAKRPKKKAKKSKGDKEYGVSRGMRLAHSSKDWPVHLSRLQDHLLTQT